MSIKLENLSFSYSDKEIFKDLSLEFKNGVFYSVSAPSGMGKTTLFRLIAGLEKLQDGKIEISGKLAYMFQEDRLFPNLTVMENVRLAESGMLSPEEILDELGIIGEINSYPDELSGGMKRRVALARTLLAPSENIILDEPFTGLDEEIRGKAIALIKRVCVGKTLLLATHDESEREFCTEHIALK